MRTLIWFLYFIFYLIYAIPAMYKAEKLIKQGNVQAQRELVNFHVKKWVSSLLKIAGVTVTLQGLQNIPKDKTVLFVSNHQGNFDIPILLSCIPSPPALLSKIEVKKLPLIRTWMSHLECVFVQRDNPRQAVSAMNDAVKVLENGRSMIIFPEGTRSRGDELGEFKAGSFRIAAKAKTPIVPIVIDGSYKIMEANKMWIKPANVTVKILPMVEIANLSKDEIKDLPEKIRSIIAANK